MAFVGGCCAAEAIAHSTAHELDSNNDRVMATQKYGGVRASSGEVTVRRAGVPSARDDCRPRAR